MAFNSQLWAVCGSRPSRTDDQLKGSAHYAQISKIKPRAGGAAAPATTMGHLPLPLSGHLLFGTQALASMARATRTGGFLGCSGFPRALSIEGLFNRSCDQLHHPLVFTCRTLSQHISETTVHQHWLYHYLIVAKAMESTGSQQERSSFTAHSQLLDFIRKH